VDYLQQVYLPQLPLALSPRRDAGSVADLSVERWGWYPEGGGVLSVTIEGRVRLGRLALTERGPLRSVSVLSAVSNLADHIRWRQAERADFVLRKQGIVPRIQTLDPPSPGQGTMLLVLAEYEHTRAAFTSYGRVRKPAERVAEEACKAYLRYHRRGQPVDEHLGDQLLLPLALAYRSAGPDDEPSQYAVESVTDHLLTQVWVIKKFLDDIDIEIDGERGNVGTVVVSRGSDRSHE
jgi:RNA 3'-terminal phosphate cyclase (ATP)